MNTFLKTPVMDHLHRFTDPSVPVFGPYEEEIEPKEWDTDVAVEGDMNRYPFMYVGEGHNRIHVVIDGRLAWTYDTGLGGELDDAWVLSNGNILFSRMYWCAEVTPEKEVVWRYDLPDGCEVHSLQPIGTNEVLMVVNAPTPRAVIMNKKTMEITYQHDIPYEPNSTPHLMFRRIRMTGEGTFLLPYLTKGKVVEYDRDFQEIWSCECAKPWSCQRLQNGNTLIVDEEECIAKEVNKEGKVVWSFSEKDAPAWMGPVGRFLRPTQAPTSQNKGEIIGWQTCIRLANGNTVFSTQGGYGKAPQFFEVTPKKEVVWWLKNWRDLGPATHIQILSDPGVPENPGECQR